MHNQLFPKELLDDPMFVNRGQLPTGLQSPPVKQPAPAPIAPTSPNGAPQPTNLALRRPADSNVAVQSGRVAGNVIDGDSATRWEARPVDNVALWIDLGDSKPIARVTLAWVGGTTKTYSLQLSNDKVNWRTVVSNATVPPGSGSIAVEHNLPAGTTARWLRVACSTRYSATLGPSMSEIGVYAPTG
jgi:hypothetical protein